MKTININKSKQEAVKYFESLPVQERLSMANWQANSMERSLSNKLGHLYYGQVSIWIKPDGSLYANKPV
jgi:hypothetical protein